MAKSSAATDMRKLQGRITELSKALANLRTKEDLRELIRIIKRPGWTTPAEWLLVIGLLESMIAQVQVLDQMSATLMRGSNAVGRR